MLHFASQVSAKSMFILKEGMLRRGTIVGVIATALFLAANHDDAMPDLRSAQFIVLGALCFLEWTIGAGWLIGAIMWSTREQSSRRHRRGPR